MNIDRIEENLIQMGIITDSFKYLLDRFEERLLEDYSFLLRNEVLKPYYYELRSDWFLFNTLLKSFNKIKNNFNSQVEKFYQES